VDVELGLAAETMARLLERVAEHPRDARIMAGLVTACRYAGLLDASLAAHARVVAIDAETRTTVTWTHFMLGNYAEAIRTDHPPPFCAMLSRVITGDLNTTGMRAFEDSLPEGGLRVGSRMYRQLADGQVEPALTDLATMRAGGFADPEGWCVASIFLARAGADAPALEWLARSVDAGYACHRALVERDHFARFRGAPEFERIVERALERVARGRLLYERAGGPAVLGPAG
jgi:hypothetical protein